MGWNRVCTHLYAVEWDTEEDDACEALLDEGAEEFVEAVDTPSALSRERGNVDASVWVVCDEDGVHEHGLVELAAGLP